MGEGPDSWVIKTHKCYRCDKITPHIPYQGCAVINYTDKDVLQNWGPVWMKCVFCGDKNLFAEYRKTPSIVNFRIFLTKKKQWEDFDIRKYICEQRC